jgi:hypothetical protein
MWSTSESNRIDSQPWSIQQQQQQQQQHTSPPVPGAGMCITANPNTMHSSTVVNPSTMSMVETPQSSQPQQSIQCNRQSDSKSASLHDVCHWTVTDAPETGELALRFARSSLTVNHNHNIASSPVAIRSQPVNPYASPIASQSHSSSCGSPNIDDPVAALVRSESDESFGIDDPTKNYSLPLDQDCAMETLEEHFACVLHPTTVVEECDDDSEGDDRSTMQVEPDQEWQQEYGSELNFLIDKMAVSQQPVVHHMPYIM